MHALVKKLNVKLENDDAVGAPELQIVNSVQLEDEDFFRISPVLNPFSRNFEH